ncbi:MAG TPA: malate synthase A [Conexibacter sp.]|nr:malate synthase A [Conexibacter sp.]
MTAQATTRAGLSDRAADEILTPAALTLVGELHARHDGTRRELLAARERRRGDTLDFLPETAAIRSGDWQASPPPADYRDRRVEITGPTDRKLVINALNSGAKGFMADFEDANAPTWANQVEGQLNLRDAIDGTIEHHSTDGRVYRLDDEIATLLVRPRGLHLPEKHLHVADEPVAGAFADFGLYVAHCAQRLLDSGRGVHFYLPKLEHHLEARLWNDAFASAEELLGLPHASLRATVLIETLPAAFQMHEMLYELRERSLGLNAGRWDYIFSTIKCFPDDPAFVTPDRASVTMTVPFMSAYANLLVKTCHERGAFAMGGMAALIPSRTDAEANERAFAAVRADKQREASAGFDGTWVAHPDVVAVARSEFDAVLGERPNQIERRRDDVTVGAVELLAVVQTPGEVTLDGLRANVSVAFEYISNWLTGRGAVGINGLMEDAATAEIARTQVWQWIRHGRFTREQVQAVLEEELAALREQVGEDVWQRGRPDEARAVLEQVALGEQLVDFLTLPAYELID